MTDAPDTVLDDTSLRYKISEIGNQVHNIGCELHGSEDLSERLAGLASRLWKAAQKVSVEPDKLGRTGAPERIWADPDHWLSHPPRSHNGNPGEYTEYVRVGIAADEKKRADDAEARLEAAEAMADSVVDLLKEIYARDGYFDDKTKAHHDALVAWDAAQKGSDE